MAQGTTLTERIRKILTRHKGVREKRMFGVGFLLNGNLLVGVWKESLVVRLGPDETDEALRAPHVRVFETSGRPMKGWLLVGPEGIKDDGKLKNWIELALKFVSMLPVKEM
jgi:hypothetical protein